MSILVFQMYFDNYYERSISMLIITISYGIAAILVIKLALLFMSWYESYHNLLVLLYFVSMSLIAFNLIMTAVITNVKLTDNPDKILEFVGGSADISAGRYMIMDNIYQVSAIVSFFSIWITTAILMNNYREKLANAVIYWVILAIPLLYFLINSLYPLIFSELLGSYLTIDPVTVLIIVTSFLSLSRPIGVLTFAIAFWKVSKTISYEKNVRTYMIISGWGLLLIFSANQAIVQTLIPYPPFGLATLSVLVVSSFLMLLGIYNAATFVSANNTLRRTIRKHASELRLLDLIGHAEMDREIQKTVTKIVQSQEEELEKPKELELDEKELKRYIDLVLRELKKDDEH